MSSIDDIINATKEFSNVLGKKKVSAIDNGFIASCIEMDETGLASKFLQDIYKMSLSEAVVHVGKVMQKKVEIS